MAAAVIFDTDAGSDIDDLYALALILNHPNLDLRGVTTVSGDTQARARLVAKLCRLAGREDVPVRAGIRIPQALLDRGVTLEMYRTNLTHTQFVYPDDPEDGRTYADGVDFILDALSAATEPITLVATGPWSNIAEVLRRADEAQRAAIGCIALMGGEVHLLHAESNAAGDPEAVDVVLHRGLPTFVGTWSITRELTFPIDEVEALIGGAETPFLRALYDCTRMWWGEGKKAKPGPVCYDVVPVFWAAGDRGSISCIRLDGVNVELNGRYTRGMTVVHPWARMAAAAVETTGPGYVTVTDTIDAAALKRRYVELVV
ncbi:MAG: nucleoside hydrolase [Planctomycetota bacterium]